MTITTVYRKYFQKSKVFLYPLLDIKKGSIVTPFETYLSWDSNYTSEDIKLICAYKIRNDEEYKLFEKNILLKHNRLVDQVIINTELMVLVFDLLDYKKDWLNLIKGDYNSIEDKTKIHILNFFDQNSGNYTYMETYLYPDKHFEVYADLLGVDSKLITDVGQVCPPPDLNKENLNLNTLILKNIN
jgi:hypothetical protein